MISKSMRFVDLETRKEVRDKRVKSLEADNYLEDEVTANNDEAYDDSDVCFID